MSCHDPIHNVIIDVSVSQTKLYHVIFIRFFKYQWIQKLASDNLKINLSECYEKGIWSN
jgi:hypothetical protein